MKKLSLFLILLVGVVSQHALANALVASVNKTRLAQNELIELRIRADFSVDSSDIDLSVLDSDFFKSGPSSARPRTTSTVSTHKKVNGYFPSRQNALGT